MKIEKRGGGRLKWGGDVVMNVCYHLMLLMSDIYPIAIVAEPNYSHVSDDQRGQMLATGQCKWRQYIDRDCHQHLSHLPVSHLPTSLLPYAVIHLVALARPQTSL